MIRQAQASVRARPPRGLRVARARGPPGSGPQGPQGQARLRAEGHRADTQARQGLTGARQAAGRADPDTQAPEGQGRQAARAEGPQGSGP